MTYRETADLIRRLMDEKIRDLFRNRRPDSLYEAMRYPIDAGGKRIRPLVLALSCQAAGGSLEDCLDAALSVELLHTFTLVHDDIMDNDALRRGRPTVHVRWDEPTAILAGDGLVTLAFDCLARTDHPKLRDMLRIYTSGLLELCEGQALDKAFEDRSSVTLEDYLDMIDKKTARLIEVSCRVGAIIGNGSNAEQDALRRYARSLGRAFQIQDDLLDLMSEESVSGKPVGSDLMRKKKTVLTIHFMEHASTGQRKRFLDLWTRPSMDRETILAVRGLFEEAGTIWETRTRIDALLDDAAAALETLRPSDPRDALNTLILRLKDRIA